MVETLIGFCVKILLKRLVIIMAINITKSDIKWSYFSLFLLNGVNLILLPFILAYLSPAEVGLWYTFTAVSGMVVLLDFGFMTTLSRNVTFVWSGAEEIYSSGITTEHERLDKPNYELFVKLFKTTKLIYLVIGLTILIVLLSLGSFYIYSVAKHDLPILTVIVAWLFYSIAVFLNMRFAYWNAILKGIGAIKENQQLLVITKLVQLIFTVISLIAGYGLIGVAISYLLSIIVNRILANKIFYSYQNNKRYIKPLLSKSLDREEYKSIFTKILPNTYKQALISISNYINLRSTTLLSSAFLGLNVTASLGIILQILTVITTVANTFFNTYLPQFGAYRLKNEKNKIKTTLKRAVLINYVIVFSSFLVVLFAGDFVLRVLNSNVELLPTPFLLLMMVYIFLYNNHSLFATFIATKNVLPHYKAFFISALLVLMFQVVLLYIKPTLWSLLLPVLIIQLMYNNWKWPKCAIEDLNRL